MKYIIFFLLLSTSVTAQRIGTANSMVHVPGKFRVPMDTTGQTAGTVAYKEGSLYYNNSIVWILLASDIPAAPGTTFYQFQDSTNTAPISFPAGVDTTYWLIGGAPSGAPYAGHPYEIAVYVNGVFDDYIVANVNDVGLVLQGVVASGWHTYNGSTWPRTSNLLWPRVATPGGGILGSSDNSNVTIVRNNVNQMVFRGAGVIQLPQYNGTGLGLTQFTSNGSLQRTEPASSSDTTTYKPLAISSAGVIVRNPSWPGGGSGPGGSSLFPTTGTGTATGDVTGDLDGNDLLIDDAGRIVADANDSILLSAATKISLNSLDSLNGRGVSIYLGGVRTTVAGSSMAYIGLIDSTAGFRFQDAQVIGFGIPTLSTSTDAYKPLQQDTTTGAIIRKLIDVSSSTQITGTLPIGNGGTNITTYTTGDIIYASATNVLSKLPIGTASQTLHVVGGVPAWRDTAVAGGNFWALASGGALTAQNTITSNQVNSIIWNGTWTATTTQDAYWLVSPSLTGGVSTPWINHAVNIKPTVLAGGNTQGVYAMTVDGTNLSANSKTGTQIAPLRIVQGAAASRSIVFNLASGGGTTTGSAYIGIDGSENLVLFSGNGAASFSGTSVSSTLFTGPIRTSSTADNSSFAAQSATSAVVSTTSGLQFASSTNSYNVAQMRPGTQTAISAGGNTVFAGLNIGSTSFQTAAPTTGAVLLGVGVNINPISAFGNNGGSATVTNTAALHINGASTITVTGLNYGFWNKASMRTDGRTMGGQGANIAAANDLTLGADGNTFIITGNTQVNAITTTGWVSGSHITLIFTGTPTVKNNTAGGAGTAVLLLAGAADFTATANDVLNLVYDGTSWYEEGRSVN